MSGESSRELNEALREFVRSSIRRHAQKVISKLQRMPDYGAHPYGWDMRSLWSIYSWDVQNGPILHSDMVTDLVEEVAMEVVNSIPEPEARLMTLHLETADNESQCPLLDAVMEEVSSSASRRNLERYDPDYRWYEDL